MAQEASHTPGNRPVSARAWLVLAIGAVAIRIALVRLVWDASPQIVDERHYLELATSLADGRGLAWANGTPTSMRPPLYPTFVAAVWWLADSRSLVPVRGVQAVLSLVTVALAALLGRRLFDERVGYVAALFCAVYPPLLLANATILAEVVFIVLLLGAVLAMPRSDARFGLGRALAAGAILGAASLTRSVVWLFPLAAAGACLLVAAPWRRRLVMAGLLLTAHSVVLAPWAVRNSVLQGVPVVVESMSGLNLWMGNSAATPEDRMWDGVHQGAAEAFAAAISADLGPGPLSEGQKDRWGRQAALSYMLAHPGVTLRRSVLKLGDLWGLDREFVGGSARGFFQLSAAVMIPLTLLVVGAFPLVAASAIVGGVLVEWPRPREHVVVVLLVLYVCAMHSLVFGHPRYRLPLMPFLMIYAAAGLVFAHRRQLAASAWRSMAAVGLLTGLCATWGREIFVRDADRIGAWLARLGLWGA